MSHKNGNLLPELFSKIYCATSKSNIKNTSEMQMYSKVKADLTVTEVSALTNATDTGGFSTGKFSGWVILQTYNCPICSWLHYSSSSLYMKSICSSLYMQSIFCFWHFYNSHFSVLFVVLIGFKNNVFVWLSYCL